MAKFGCAFEVPLAHWSEHISSQLHQEAVMAAIKILETERGCFTTHHSSRQSNADHRAYDELSGTVEILGDAISSLHDDNLHVRTELEALTSALAAQQQVTSSLKVSCDESYKMLQAVQLNNSIREQDVESMNRSVSEFSSLLSNDGSFIWKITDVMEKLQNAKQGQAASIYSPPFYSSPAGYKMCLRLYLNGDGQAKGTHMSLFFVLMRGEYDAILSWPFTYKITFCLYDQTGRQSHIIDSMRPDEKSNSFQRPRSNMNIASGIPKFVPVPVMEQANNPYVRDDCMFVRCIVHFDPMPKAVIPYVLGLNTGLPSVVRQAMIESQMRKYPTVTTSDPA